MLVVQWSVKYFFAPNSPMFRIRLPEKREEEEEEEEEEDKGEHRYLQSLMRFTQTQKVI